MKAFARWRKDWCAFAREMLQVELDPEQEEILRSVQFNRKTSVCSGTSRGKDYVAAVCCICFLYLTPRWNAAGEMIENTKVAMTAPTDRQVGNIMFPEISRIFNRAKYLPGRLVGYDIRTDVEEWFLTGFKADDNQTEAWTGFHAANVLFVITEASGLSEKVAEAIEGNLQGNSRLLIVFNPNRSTGYAAASQRSSSWSRFRLSSLTAPNVKAKRIIYPGQVDYDWIRSVLTDHCVPINEADKVETEGDFEFEGHWYRPDDFFRVKVLGLFPKVSEGSLVPGEWIELANARWRGLQVGETLSRRGNMGTPRHLIVTETPLRLGVDVAGMGRDNSCLCHRFSDYVDRFELIHGGGEAVHMKVAGRVVNAMKERTDSVSGQTAKAFIDTIGEGAGVFSRLRELASSTERWMDNRVISAKYSEAAGDGDFRLRDVTGQREFLNMRAYLLWAVRDWLDPKNKCNPALPTDDDLYQELTQTQWETMSNGRIKIEAKEELKKRIKRSPDKSDALALTFWPTPDIDPIPAKRANAASFFH